MESSCGKGLPSSTVGKFEKALSWEEFLEKVDLEPHRLYEVWISNFQGNPWMQGFLFVHFMDGQVPTSYLKLVDGDGDTLVIGKEIRFAAVKEIASLEGHVSCGLSFMDNREY